MRVACSRFAVIALILLVLRPSAEASVAGICADASDHAARTSPNLTANRYITDNRFTTGRDLDTSSNHFLFTQTPTLKQMVMALERGSIIVDMGTGEGHTIVDALNLNTKISLGVGITAARPKRALLESAVPGGRFRRIDGDFVENLVHDGKLNYLMGKVRLLTDVFGPMSYSENLPELLQTYVDLLARDGIAIFNLMQERTFEVLPNAQRQRLTNPELVNSFLVNGQRDPLGLIAWLKTIPGIEVVEVAERRVNVGPGDGMWEDSLAIKIRKTSDWVTVPKTLRAAGYLTGNPPVRVFDVLSGDRE